jgi:hypothetical protein
VRIYANLSEQGDDALLKLYGLLPLKRAKPELTLRPLGGVWVQVFFLPKIP